MKKSSEYISKMISRSGPSYTFSHKTAAFSALTVSTGRPTLGEQDEKMVKSNELITRGNKPPPADRWLIVDQTKALLLTLAMGLPSNYYC